MATPREQKLVDIMFQVAMTLTMENFREHFASKSREEVAEWVAYQLRACGFETKPCGLSWEVLR